MNEAAEKGKRTAEKSGKESSPETKPEATPEPVDLVKVRENIKNLVGAAAEEITKKLIEVAQSGQLASAKYLFEAVGLHPSTEGTEGRDVEHSLAHTLLTRMGLPLEPVVCDEELAPAGLTSYAKGATEPISVVKEAVEEKREREDARGPFRAASEE